MKYIFDFLIMKKNYLFSFFLLILININVNMMAQSLFTSPIFGYQSLSTFNLVGNNKSSHSIEQISVQYGVWSGVSSMQLKFSHGGTGDSFQISSYNGAANISSDTFSVPIGQFISSIYLCVGPINWQLVESIQFATNQGVQSPNYGILPSRASTASTCYTISLPGGLLGIVSYSTNVIVSGLSFVSSAPITNASVTLPDYSAYSAGFFLIFYYFFNLFF